MTRSRRGQVVDVVREPYGLSMFRHDAHERRRLDLLAADYDSPWHSRLAALGVGPGWSCLDVGAGTGALAQWMVDEAGADTVMAVDSDITYLREIFDPRIRVVAANVTDVSFSPGRFDLVHARSVLFHVPERYELIQRMASWLRPNGWLVVGDPIDPQVRPSARPRHPAFHKTMRAMWQAVHRTLGTDIAWVSSYPALLTDLGLTNIGWEMTIPGIYPGSASAERWRLAWINLRQEMLATGMLTDAEFEDALHYLASPELSETASGMLLAWGRRPG